jgi:hypothetical protein
MQDVFHNTQPLFCVHRYDPHHNRWHMGPPLSVRRFALAGAALNNAVYAVGGFDGAAYMASAERLDPREGRWAPVASMAAKRGGHACATSGGLLFAIGGFCNEAINACEVYDPRADAWRAVAPMGDCRAYGAAVALGSEVLAVGGLRADMQTHSRLIERYLPALDRWEPMELPAAANPRRSFLAACALE